MYYYEKDYIMRLIHGTAMVLARLLLGRQMENEGEISTILDKQEKEQNDLLLRMVDERAFPGQVKFLQYAHMLLHKKVSARA